MYEWRAKAQLILRYLDNLNRRILRMVEGTFSLEAAQIYLTFLLSRDNGISTFNINKMSSIWLLHVRTFDIQWTLVTTTAFVSKDVAVKMSLLLCAE